MKRVFRSIFGKSRNRKYFCIGRNKTGTTSLKMAFKELGFSVGNQPKAKLLADKHYFEGEFEPIIQYCRSAHVFQDAPFSFPETYKHMDAAFPGSKFILTVRDSPEQWYNSFVEFHRRMFGQNGELPTKKRIEELELSGNLQGLSINVQRLHHTPDNDIYNKDIMIDHYTRHNNDILEYFSNRPEDLLVINISRSGDYKRFLDFIETKSHRESFPWKNKTSSIRPRS